MQKTQIIIIGGGLAGLTAAIHLSRQGLDIVLIEKNSYPHHKVCGEYLSQEIEPYLKSLEIDLLELKAPLINKLEYSSVSGKTIHCNLEMGGLGISRYQLDEHLYKKALNSGCKIVKSLALDIEFKNDNFQVSTSKDEKISAEFVLGAFGKRSNLDKKLSRDFINDQSGWLAVKAHYKTGSDFYPDDLVSLHNFDGGYCGLSKTELGTINACYLASYNSFKNHRDTDNFKKNVLMKNPHLKRFFSNSEMVFDKELSIAQVCFDKKTTIENHVIMIGDSAGLIHPLCGNGMAMAIHSAKIASEHILKFYKSQNTMRSDVEKAYFIEWNKHFRSRVRTGRFLQKVFLNESLANISQNLLNKMPGILPHIIKRTHGNLVHV